MDTNIGKETEIVKDYVHRMVASKSGKELRVAYEHAQMHLQVLQGMLYLSIYESENEK